MRWFRLFRIDLIVGFQFIFLFLICANLIVKTVGSETYQSVDLIPHTKVGLLLGTSKYVKNGNLNAYYTFRIEAAYALYKAGKIDRILISGDNSRPDYDEPTMMKNDLIALGFPAEKIELDYAGFRTLDSIYRCKKKFGHSKVTIISQQFHNERAIFLGRHYDLEAIGYNAKDVTKYYGFLTKIREFMARGKVVLDMMLGVGPTFEK